MIDDFAGIRLDIGSGAATRAGWFGIDSRAHPAVTLPWDLEQVPWPLPDACALEAFAGFVVNRINPARWGVIAFFDEVWRLLKPECVLTIVTYYGCNARYQADPAACNPVTEQTLYYLDPAHRSGLWHVYQPQPWAILDVRWDAAGNLEAQIAKRN